MEDFIVSVWLTLLGCLICHSKKYFTAEAQRKNVLLKNSASLRLCGKDVLKLY